MKTKILRTALTIALLFAAACDEPETVVTNYVHPDGSVTRKIIMRSIANDFSKENLQVPYDSTWTMKDSLEVTSNGDTIWIKTAEKHFMNVAELNDSYKSDSGVNRNVPRYAVMKKRFAWFNTTYRFSENIDRQLVSGYPISDFLNQEELKYFYAPEFLRDEWSNGPDSLRYKALSDTINKKTDRWGTKVLMSEFILQFEKLATGKDASSVISGLRSREDELINLIEKKYSNHFDSLWEKGVILADFIGEENAKKYRTEADSAVNLAMSRFMISFKDYSVRIVMPGKLTATNGYIDSTRMLVWPVRSDFFMTQDYQMWAESKVRKTWAWIVTGLFLLFVLAGIIGRSIKKG